MRGIGSRIPTKDEYGGALSGHLTLSGGTRAPGAAPLEVVPGSLSALKRLGMAAALSWVAAAAQPASAATTFSPFASVEYQHNSNVFEIPGLDPAYEAAGITALGDSIENYEAGLNSRLDWGADSLTLIGQATREQFDRFSFLDHTEYRFNADYLWRLGAIVDGNVIYAQRRYMAAFTNTLSTALLLNTDKSAIAAVRVLMTPEWRLDLTPEFHQVDTPVPGFRGFALQEKIGVAGVDYLGFGKLTAGVQFTYDSGRYTGIEDATRYDERSVDLTASYRVSGFSSFNASAGYSSRDSEPNPADSVAAQPGVPVVGYDGTVGTTSGATGSLTYHRQITGKTSADLKVFRRVDSYVAGANAEIGTGAAFGMSWKADPKITAGLNFGLQRDQIKGGLVVVNTTNRTDNNKYAQFEVRYAALTWLTIRPYVNWQKATSTFRPGNYSATILGIDVTGRLRW